MWLIFLLLVITWRRRGSQLFSLIFLLSRACKHELVTYPSLTRLHTRQLSAPASERERVVNNEEIRGHMDPRLLFYGSYSGEIYGAINQLSLMWGIKQKGCRRLTSTNANNNCSNFSFISLLTGGVKRERKEWTMVEWWMLTCEGC